MTIYLIHRGTDTWIDLDDNVIYLDSESVEGDIDTDNADDVLAAHGIPVNAYTLNPEVNIANSICLSPAALAVEINEGLRGLPEHVRDWAHRLSIADLQRVSEDVLQDERLWDAFNNAIIDTLITFHNDMATTAG